MVQALTIGEIARRLNWPIHRVDYLIRSRGLEPAFRAGNLRVFSETIIDRLRQEGRRKESAAVKPHFEFEGATP